MYQDDHFTGYTNIYSICCTPETYIMLYVNYSSIKKQAPIFLSHQPVLALSLSTFIQNWPLLIIPRQSVWFEITRSAHSIQTGPLAPAPNTHTHTHTMCLSVQQSLCSSQPCRVRAKPLQPPPHLLPPSSSAPLATPGTSALKATAPATPGPWALLPQTSEGCTSSLSLSGSPQPHVYTVVGKLFP